jgi:hypothetical protein
MFSISFHISTYISSILSKYYHYSTYVSSVFSISFHNSTYFSSVFSISFHYWIYFSSVFSKSFHYATYFVPHFLYIYFRAMGILWNKFKSQENFKTYLCWEYHWVSCVSEWGKNEEK